MTEIENYLQNIFGLSKKKIFITGINSGIGKEIAYALAMSGAEIIGTFNNQYPAELIEEIKKKNGVIECRRLNLDVKNFEDEINDIFDKHGVPDILINCAGVNLRNWFQDYSIDDWDSVINTNLTSVFKLSQFFVKKILKNEMSGKIINIASLLSFQGGQRSLGYTVSKHGILGMSKLMANELGKYGITVNCIVPGYIETNMTSEFMGNTEVSDCFKKRIPLQRWGIPKDLVGTIILLCSKSSDYINGATITIDGGYINN